MRNVAACAAVLCATIAAAQTRVGEMIEVSIVNVDVVVTDRAGNRVRGLTAADFEVREQGREQVITHFAEYGDATLDAAVPPAPAAAESAPPGRPARNVVVFIEPARLPSYEARTLYDGLRSLVQSLVETGDRAAIVSWSDGMRVRQPFTDDVAALVAALTDLEREVVETSPDLAAQTRRQQQDIERHDAEAAAFAQEMQMGLPPAPRSPVPVQSLLAARQQLAAIRKKADAVETLMQAISALDGRKILILGLHRFGLRAGAEFFDGPVPVDYRRELDTSKLRAELIRTANAHGITLYPVYAAGLRWDPDESVFARNMDTASDADRLSLQNRILLNETESLDEMAAKTGGTMAWGSANIAGMLPRVAGDLQSYYSLAYRAPSTGKDVSRAISVRAKNPAYVVRTRSQFVEKSDRSLMRERVRATLFQPLIGADIPFDVILGEVRNAGRRKSAVPIELRIPISALATRPEGSQESGEFSVYVVSGGASGAASEVEQRAQPFRIPRSDIERARGSYYTYALTVLISEGVDLLSIGVMDETSKEFGLKRVRIPGTSRR